MLEQLKKLDKKFLIIVGCVIIIPILLIIILALARGCSSKTNYSNYEDKLLKAGEKYFKETKKLPSLEGQIEEISLEKLVDKGYIKSADKLLGDKTCSGVATVQNNGASIKENEGGLYLYRANLSCDEYKTSSLKDDIISKVVESGAGLYKVNDEYIFRGETDVSKAQYVDNFIEFYGKMYRIIKVDASGDLKLLKVEQEKHSTNWDTKYNESVSKNYGENLYADSNLLKTLVDDYNNSKKIKADAKKYIVAKNVCVGKRSSSNISKELTEECSIILEDQVIQTANLTDYSASSLDNDCTTIYSRSCRNYNYLRNVLTDSWTIVGLSDNTYEAYNISDGLPNYDRTNSTNKYNLVFYISGNVSNFTGEGSETNPYILK